MSKERYYAAIDLKSFFASVECIDRDLDPLNTNLVVADASRTDKTICLAVTPSLKALGVPSRPRLFEVVQQMGLQNAIRREKAPQKAFQGSSFHADVLDAHPELSIDYIVAPPRMQRYMDFSAKVYEIYLQYMAPEDIHVYSIDEVFLDLTPYLRIAGLSPKAFVGRIVNAVYQSTGITATAGIGTNLYLCKVAMDIVAKRAQPDASGLRIAQLDELAYRQLLWNHLPLTDFWRIGRGYEKKLKKAGLHTMGDIARCSLGGPEDFYNEDLLYKLFGVNAELLIDHAWGLEPCTLQHIKAYKPSTHSLSSGQVLHCPYPYEKACLVVREMADAMAMTLTEKGLVAHHLVLCVNYDKENLSDTDHAKSYTGAITTDHYGRQVPKHAQGTYSFPVANASCALFLEAAKQLCAQIMDPTLLVRKLNIAACHVIPLQQLESQPVFQQLDFWADNADLQQQCQTAQRLLKEQKKQKAMLHIKHRFGKNAIFRCMNLQEGATARERNRQVGGHKA